MTNYYTACTFCHTLKSHWVICIINWLVSLGSQMSDESLPLSLRWAPPLFLSPSPFHHRASRPAVAWESIGELSLLPVFLPHRWQVVPCPAWGKEVCVWERGLQVREWTYFMGGRRWTNQDTLVLIYLWKWFICLLSSLLFPKMWGWLTWRGTCFVLLLLRHDTCPRNGWCEAPLLNRYLA